MMTRQNLTRFSQPGVLKGIRFGLLQLLLQPFERHLTAANLPLPNGGPPDAFPYEALAAYLGSPNLPADLYTVLRAVERVAAPSPEDLVRDRIRFRQKNRTFSARYSPVEKAIASWCDCRPSCLELLPQEKVSVSPVGSDETPPVANPKPRIANASTSNVSSGQASAPIANPKSPIENPSTSNVSSGQTCSPIENQKSKIENPDDLVFHRLALLTPAQYDRVREQEAKLLNIRARTLDAEVERVRTELAEIEANKLQLQEIKPWPEPVNGSEVMDAIAGRFSRYLVLTMGAADAMALWSGHTHALAAFTHSPRLNFCAPAGECGKTTALEIVSLFVPRPLFTENLKAAVLFRAVSKFAPSVLFDESDNFIFGNKEILGLLNAGHGMGATAHRCEGGKPRAFHAYAAVALAGIGDLPRALALRSIIIPMLKPKPTDTYVPFDRRDTQLERELASKLARWVQDNFAAIQATRPAVPPGVRNRLADNWRPLFALAHVLGGPWPQRALNCFYSLTASQSLDTQDTTIALLHDIREVFLAAKTDRLASAELIQALLALPGRPWPEAHKANRPITETWVARRLAPFGIVPKLLFIKDRRLRGYELASFRETFERFLKPIEGRTE